MKLFFIMLVFFGFALGALEWHLGFFSKIKQLNHHVELKNQFESKAIVLMMENKNLKKELQDIKFQMRSLEAKNNYLEIKLNEKTAGRTIASIASKPNSKDMVAYDIYQWSAEKLHAIGVQELKKKNYEKSAQYLHQLVEKFPNDKLVDDSVLFQAGVASYESKEHNAWAIDHFKLLIKKYPKSAYFRGAKLWLALAELHSGNKKHFFATVEEFRLYYRNTDEWKILSKYYEEFAYRYQK